MAQEDGKQVKNKYAPDFVRLQFAGDIGMFSVGPSWLIVKEKLEIGLGVGLVPSNSHSEAIYTTSLRAMYSPNWTKTRDRFAWEPLSIGLVGCRHNGLDLSRYRDNDYYPDNYYWWGVKTRVGLALDTELSMSFEKGPFSDISMYLEASIWDVYLFSVFDNGNDDYLGLDDLLVMGTGLKFYLRR